MKPKQVEARQLRQEGLSLNDIAQNLNVSIQAVRRWTRDIQLTQEQKLDLKTINNFGPQVNREKFKELRCTYQEAGRAKARENRSLHRAGCMLYWAEGSKTKPSLDFGNTDANMILLFIRFLREEMGVSDSEIRVHIQCHTDDPLEIERIEKYWLNLLNLSPSNLTKTSLKKGNKEAIRHHNYENGICILSVHSVEVLQHIFGAIQEYAGFNNPKWLG